MTITRKDAQEVPGILVRTLLRQMMRIRCVEETLAELYAEQEMRTPTHFSIGQEAVAVGVCAALQREDVIYSGHRCHAHYLAKGGSLIGMVGELYGKEIGAARGRGGSVHLTQPDVGIIASSAILGQTIAVAVGSAFAFQMDNTPRVAVCFFGDGAVEEGIFHESLNFAAVRRVPVIFVCENNLYSTHTPLAVRHPTDRAIYERVRSYGIPSAHVDGNDAVAVYHETQQAVERGREGGGPSFLECATYRWREHVGPLWDFDRGYRSKAEVEEWMERCPIKRLSEYCLGHSVCAGDELQSWRREFQQEIADAVTVAKRSPFPSPDSLLEGTY
ncbi:MAG TPA: thiamine pyrophosphate-dependent dehydrogenase E1 component subunit alpha [bacterium]|nr:thiamine pyrophosphate-dependent dehydrogenase E1 component subunit alpha [bacterium]